ncbi:Glucose-6-phosphate 1-epimerase-like protein [Hapsidospora chrysogenum ATCC 11550]|uniref:Glucose-6-phosphate 1-epimerase n=1 Tax=Hapsidospora chrysogenum (strain ATCC 11550 / CBS 779.69 / DSM 880 / IAM 14645 / JCM 23072 / IMI 49137) TaxID=857340 RepID=A0A086TAP5_HAPC1|nr:Glucose-6-phosphate 1-epimerase-like protein [Hapsidospora chrysogenum ATCC 11550]
MVERANKPSALAATPGLPPQAQVNISDDNSMVTAQLPTGETIEILLHGATILSWKDAAGDEKLWLSENAKLDGSGPARGGIPLVFPVFGTNSGHAVEKLPQHGFARNSRWEFLGKSTSEGATAGVKLDFGLSSQNLDEATRKLWPYAFGLIYSVTLDRESLNTTLVITNDGEVPFEFQTLLHTYFKVNDIESVQVTGLEDSPYVDKLDGLKVKNQSGTVTFTGETDRVYTPAKGPSHPIVISDGGKPRFRIVRDNLDDAVVFNPWVDKANSLADFTPKDGWRKMVCVEPGSVSKWQTLEKGDAFEAAQTIYLE